MVNMIQESWQLTKILCNSGPHCTWVLYPSQGWCLFNIFRVYLWKNTQRYIENNVCSSKQKGCTLLSMIFLSLGSRLSRIQNSRGENSQNVSLQTKIGVRNATFPDKIFLSFWFYEITNSKHPLATKKNQRRIKWRHNAHSNQISQEPKSSRGTKWLFP